MKQLLDFIPLILFFLVYKLDAKVVSVGGYSFEFGGIFSATMVLLISTVSIFSILFMVNKKLETKDIITLVGVVFFGGLTLFFHNDLFIKWKAPIINWIFGAILLTSQIIGRKTILQRLMGHALKIDTSAWRKLNAGWAFFFIFLGAINLWVAFTFERIWVDFKVFGSMALTFLFLILQVPLLIKYQKQFQCKQHKLNSSDAL